MRSWKQKKIRIERMRAKRRGKQRAVRSGCYLKATVEPEKKPTGYKDFESLEFIKKMKKLAWRSVFRKG